MATAKTIEQLDAATQINAGDKLPFAQAAGTEAKSGTVAQLAEAVADINEDGALAELVYATSQGKNAVAAALTAKGITTAASETLIQMADKVNNLNVDTTQSILLARPVTNTSYPATSIGTLFIPGPGYNNVLYNEGTLYVIPEGQYDSVEAMLAASVSNISLTYTLASKIRFSWDASYIMALTVDSDSAYHVEMYKVNWDTHQISFYQTVTPSSGSTVLTANSEFMCDPNGTILAWTTAVQYPTVYFWNINTQSHTFSESWSSTNFTHPFIAAENLVTLNSTMAGMNSVSATNDQMGSTNLTSESYANKAAPFKSKGNSNSWQTFAYNWGFAVIPGTSKILFFTFDQADSDEIPVSETYSLRQVLYYTMDVDTDTRTSVNKLKKLGIPVVGRPILNLSSQYWNLPGRYRTRVLSDGTIAILSPYFSEGSLVYNITQDELTYTPTDNINAMFIYYTSSQSSIRNWTVLCKNTQGGYLVANYLSTSQAGSLKNIGEVSPMREMPVVCGYKRTNISGLVIYAGLPYVSDSCINNGYLDYNTTPSPAVPDSADNSASGAEAGSASGAEAGSAVAGATPQAQASGPDAEGADA